jgi:hypothetical protein
MATHQFRETATSIFDKHQVNIYHRIWYYVTTANKLMEHNVGVNPPTTQVNPNSRLPHFRFFGLKPLDEELSAFVNHKVSVDTTVDTKVLLAYRKYIKPLLTAYVNATEEERSFVIVDASERDPDMTTMSKFTVGVHAAKPGQTKTKRVYITKTVGDEPDHCDNIGAFGDYFRYIMRGGSPYTDLLSVSLDTTLQNYPDMSTLRENETEQSKKYAMFLHDMLLTFIHDSHSVAWVNK